MLTPRDVVDIAHSNGIIDPPNKNSDEGINRAFAQLKRMVADEHPKAIELLKAKPQIRRAMLYGHWPYYGARMTDVRNLLLHVYAPKGDSTWREILQQVHHHQHIFNGRKIVAIASDKLTVPPHVVEKELPGCELLRLPNDPLLRETATLLPLLLSVKDELGGTLYLHTKSNSTAENAKGARRWTNCMLHYMLCEWQTCFGLLADYVAVGTTKMVWPKEHDAPYPSGLKRGLWMHSGTMFWMRNDFVFNHPKWREIAPDRYGTESWLPGLFPAVSTISVYQPWPVWQFPAPSPYDPNLYPEEFDEPCKCKCIQSS